MVAKPTCKCIYAFAIPYSRVVKRTSLISTYSLLGAGLILLSKYFLLSAPL